MVDISDGIQFRRDGVDPTQWPTLSCSQANQLALEVGDLRLDANREIFLQGNGQLRSSGDMLFFTGGSSLEQLRILADGNIGIGTAAPTTKLEVNGTVKATTFQGNGATLDGIVKKMGDTISGALTINNALTVSGKVGIGTSTTPANLEVNGTVKATAFQGNGANLDGIVKTTGDNTISGALTINNALTVSGKVGIGTSTTPANLEVNGTVKATTFQGNGSGLTGLVGTTQWSNGANGSIYYNGGKVGIGTSTTPANLEVNGTVTATAFQGNGATLDGIVTKTGGTISGALTINNALTVSGNVGIGKPDAVAKLEVYGNLKLQQGVAVNKFSSDGKLTDNTDLSVPTEKAVKTYVDAKIDPVIEALPLKADTTQVELKLSVKADTAWALQQLSVKADTTWVQTQLSGKAALAGASSVDFQTKNLTVSGNLTTTGNVGIGTTTPQGFQIVLPESSKPLAPNPGVTITGGKVGNANIELRNNGTGTPFIDFAIKTDTDYDARIRLTEVGKLAIEGANVGIGTTSPSRKLHVVGDIYVEGNVIATGKYWSKSYSENWETIRKETVPSSGGKNWIWEQNSLPSDLQLKKDIVPINNALATVEQLQPVSFHWLDSNYFLKEVDKNLLHEAVQTEQDIEVVNQVKEKLKAKLERQQLGFIAQDVQRVFPDWVETGEDGYKKLNMTQLNAMLVQCIKELKAAHDESEAKNRDLKRRLEILEKKVN